MKKTLFLLLPIALLSASCSKDDPAPELTIGATEYRLEAEQGSRTTATFETNISWTSSVVYAGSDSGWLSVSPASGQAGETTLTFTASAANPSDDERTAYVDIAYGEMSRRLTVVQDALGEMTIETTEYRLSWEENSSVTARIEVGIEWQANVVPPTDGTQPWLSVSPASGQAGETTLTFTASAANPSDDERTAYVDIVYGEKSRRLTIVQEGVNIADAFDPLFAQELQRRGYIPDATRITPGQVKDIEFLNLDGQPGNLTSLRGIEYFESLRGLYCEDNQLTTLDVSKNTALEGLACGDNRLTTLDVSQNTALTDLYCEDNQLTSLNVSGCAVLTKLYCDDNQLTTLDMSGCAALTDLSCDGNRLTTLVVSQNTALEVLYCDDNQLATLDVSGCAALTELVCYDNRLTSLDVSQNTALEGLACDGNQLTTLDVSGCAALTELYCYDNQLTTLDVSGCAALEGLACNNNQLTTLDVSKNTVLEGLVCSDNQLTSLDVSKNTALTYLSCSNNPGDGVSKFPVTAWFDNSAIPSGFPMEGWTYEGKYISVDYRKAD